MQSFTNYNLKQITNADANAQLHLNFSEKIVSLKRGYNLSLPQKRDIIQSKHFDSYLSLLYKLSL